MLRKVKGNINKQCSWDPRLNIVKPPPQTRLHLKVIPIKSPAGFFGETDKLILKLTQGREPRTAKIIFKNNSTVEGLTLSSFRTYYKSAVTRSMWYWTEVNK